MIVSGGLDMANNVIAKVAAGVLDTDAVNVSQLNSAITGSISFKYFCN